MKINNFFCLLVVVCAPLFLLADETDIHIRVAERQTVEEKNDDEDLAPQTQNNNFFSYIFDHYPNSYYPASIHWLASVAAFGDSVELEDGSVWKVSLYDQYKANHWRSEDPLLITQNHRWFSKYNYRIINKNSGASIETNLQFGPFKDGIYTLNITSVDPTRNTIQAINGKNEITHWEICAADKHAFNEWDVYDAIIVGYNSGWYSDFECILINVNMNNCVRAKQF